VQRFPSDSGPRLEKGDRRADFIISFDRGTSATDAAAGGCCSTNEDVGECRTGRKR
jgi:hypothetical protein